MAKVLLRARRAAKPLLEFRRELFQPCAVVFVRFRTWRLMQKISNLVDAGSGHGRRDAREAFEGGLEKWGGWGGRGSEESGWGWGVGGACYGGEEVRKGDCSGVVGGRG